jgi:hypothetical protein
MTASLDAERLGDLLDEAVSAGDTDAKGKALEALVAYLFECIPGCIVEVDVTSHFGSEQVDVAVGNARLPDGLPLYPHAFLIECKNYDEAVGSSAVGYFLNTLRARSIEIGVMVAASGISGNKGDMSYAHSLATAALAQGTRLVVLTLDDIKAVTSLADLLDLLNRRMLRSMLHGIGAP